MFEEDLDRKIFDVVVEFLLVRIKNHPEDIAEASNIGIDIIAVVRPVDGPDRLMFVPPYQYLHNTSRYELVDVTYEDRKETWLKKYLKNQKKN